MTRDEELAGDLRGLLVDMRRKYLHAKSREHDGHWLIGVPITAAILERWIPTVEQAAEALGEKHEKHHTRCVP